MELDFVAIKSRADYVNTLFNDDDYDHTRLIHLFPALTADVLALLEYLDSYEKALKPLRGKTFTYVPGLEMLNTVTGPSVADLKVRIAELEAEVENLQRAYNAEMRESVRRR